MHNCQIEDSMTCCLIMHWRLLKIKHSRAQGGIIGLTLRGLALARWFLAKPIISQYSMIYRT